MQNENKLKNFHKLSAKNLKIDSLEWKLQDLQIWFFNPPEAIPLSDRPGHKRKNLEFQMLAAVYHKGDHGQYCYTLK